MPKKGELTLKEQQFVKEYPLDFNASEAAIRAGYSKKSAGAIGHENLKKPKIQAALQREIKERQRRTEITGDMVVAELGRLAFSNITDFIEFDDSGVAIKCSSNDLPDDLAACISEVSETENMSGGKNVKFKLHDKRAALEALGKHFGLFKTKIELPKRVTLVITDD